MKIDVATEVAACLDDLSAADGPSSQDKACAAVAKHLPRVLSHATTVDDELQRSKAPSYPINDHLVQSNCQVLLCLLGPVIPLPEAMDVSALEGYGVAPATLASVFATQWRESDMQGAFRWLAGLSTKLREATTRPGDDLVTAWHDATNLLRKAVTQAIEQDLPRLAGKPAALGDDFADVEGLPAEIASILKRGDFPALSDDEYAKLGAWLTANAPKHYDGPDPADMGKTRRMEEAKTRLRGILEHNATSRQLAGSALSLIEFMELLCEPLSKNLQRSRRDSLMSAARRGIIELPKHAGKWRTGQSKKYPPEALMRAWPKYLEHLPGLPKLKPS